MGGCNFCIYENKIFDLHGHEIIPDEDNIVKVIFNGLERRFIAEKMINFLKEGGYNSLFKKPKKIAIPKEPKPKEPKPIKVKIVKAPKEKILKAPKVKVAKVQKKQIVKVVKEKKPQYKKVEFDKRKLGNDNGFAKKKVLCSNGKVYNSLYEAQKELNINRTGIFNCCQGTYKQTKGYSFEYLENK
jgi:hypothetical protein